MKKTYKTGSCPLCSTDTILDYANIGGIDYFQCESCEFIFQARNQLLSPEAELAQYELHENSFEDQDYRKFLSRLSGPLSERLSEGDRGIDYGCGPAPVLADIFSKLGFPTEVYDPFYAKDVSVLGRRYKFVTCTEVAEHFYEPNKEFTQMFSLLESGGFLGVMTRFPPRKLDFPKWHYHRDPTHVSFYSERSFQFIANRFEATIDLIQAPDIVIFRKN